MPLNRSKLYLLLLIACAAGYIWIYFGLTVNGAGTNPAGICPLKHTTNIPCPSCGSTRSVMSLVKGDFADALYFNPFGLIIAAIMLLVPFWIIFDLSFKRDTLYIFYNKIESGLKKPRYAIPLVMIVVINWIWNIVKGI